MDNRPMEPRMNAWWTRCSANIRSASCRRSSMFIPHGEVGGGARRRRWRPCSGSVAGTSSTRAACIAWPFGHETAALRNSYCEPALRLLDHLEDVGLASGTTEVDLVLLGVGPEFGNAPPLTGGF